MMEILESAPSTMDIARKNLHAGRVIFDAQGRAVPAGVLTREQTAGRGTRGRTWYARPGECLCATYYFQHGLAAPEKAGQIAFVAGVAAARTLQQIVDSTAAQPQTPVRVGLKWPNDVLLNGKKAGGILIELVQPSQTKIPAANARSADPLVALVGIGINIDVMDFPPELDAAATSLRREDMNYGDGNGWRVLGERLADALAHWGERWRIGGLAAILPSWRAYDQTPGRRYDTIVAGVRVDGRAEGVDAAGALLLRLADSRLVSVHSASSLREQIGLPK